MSDLCEDEKIIEIAYSMIFEDYSDDFDYFKSLVEKYHPEGFTISEHILKLKDDKCKYRLSKAFVHFLEYLNCKYPDKLHRIAVLTNVFKLMNTNNHE